MGAGWLLIGTELLRLGVTDDRWKPGIRTGDVV